MNEANSLSALINPGDAENFFEIDGLPDFQPGATAIYSRTNALWLAEFCRLIYRRESDELPNRPPGFHTRNHFLAARGWREEPGDFFNKKDSQAGLFLNKTLGCGALVFRGTLGIHDTIVDLQAFPTRWKPAGHVHSGFKEALEAVWAAIETRLRAITVPVFFTGHSLGAAMATLAASRCLQTPKQRPAALYTFGSPRIGDADFGKTLNGLLHCRVVNHIDIVPTVPPDFVLLGFEPYRHVGQLHRLDHFGHRQGNPPETESASHRNPMEGLVEVVKSVNKLFAEVREGTIPLPETLTDHAPVNYTAHLEKTN